MKTSTFFLTAAFAAALMTTACLRVKTEPVEVKPIKVTVDVNVRMEEELKDFFSEIDEADPTIQTESDAGTKQEETSETD